MASGGIIPGILTCFLSGAIAALGLFLLSKCAAKAPHRRSSFFAVSQMTFPKAAVLFDGAVVIKCFGVSIRCAFDLRLSVSSTSTRADGRLLLQLPHNTENTNVLCREGLVPCLVAIRPTGVGALWSHLDIYLHDSAHSTVLSEELALSSTH